MTHNPDSRLPVYHIPSPTAELAERAAIGWVRFGLELMTAHLPNGDTCRACAQPWNTCPVVVAARKHGLEEDLNVARERDLAGAARRW